MKDKLFTLPNVISLCRLAFLPVLWWFALQGKTPWVGIGIMVALLSDILDGQLARRLNQMTKFGSQLDSLADNLLVPSTIAWLLMLRPEVLEGHNRMVVIIAAAIYAVLLAVGYLRFRRFANLHLYSGKASGVIGTLFMLHAFVFGFHPMMFYLAVGMFTLANCEGLLLMLTRSEVNEHIGSILRKQPAM
ncbi:CDP-alcohol phosphatidyltransferase family protein [Candidatus Poribacteria bacterium]|nr:CDP-alcohol phosphatidyltransferase family protein [Candidatus Poribacteria bacterium]